MGSGYFGEPNLLGSTNNERERGNNGSSSSSSKKGKKSNSDKPRQPQRGLGVAQLEKIRLHGQNGCVYGHSLPLHNPYPTNDDMRVQAAYSTIPSSSFSYSSSTTSSSPPYGYNPSMMMGLNEYERTNPRYGDSQSTARWDPNNGMFESQYITQPNMTRHLLNLHLQDSHYATGQHRSTNSMGSTSQNSESSDTQDLDLELRLSL